MQPTRVGERITVVAKGQDRTLGVSDDLDHVIAVARVGGGDLRELATGTSNRKTVG